MGEFEQSRLGELPTQEFDADRESVVRKTDLYDDRREARVRGQLAVHLFEQLMRGAFDQRYCRSHVDAVTEGEDLSEIRVVDVMTAPVERATMSLQLSGAAAMMTNFGIKHLPVVDNRGNYVGMVSSTDSTTELA